MQLHRSVLRLVAPALALSLFWSPPSRANPTDAFSQPVLCLVGDREVEVFPADNWLYIPQSEAQPGMPHGLAEAKSISGRPRRRILEDRAPNSTAPVYVRESDRGKSLDDPTLEPLILTKKVLVRADNLEQARLWGERVGARAVDATIADGLFMLRFNTFQSTLHAANALQADGIWANPQFKKRYLSAQIPQEALPPGFPAPTDPLFEGQWHLLNYGQGIGFPGVDANVVPAWDDGITGAGVTIAVADNGVDLGHPDLDTNTLPVFDDSEAPWHRNFASDNSDPSVNLPPGFSHGTEVAGVSAARLDNGLGGSGAAPDANIIAIRFESSGPFLFIDDEIAAETFTWRLDRVDVHNNSWGSAGFEPQVEPLTAAALEQAITEGRDGKGVIIVKAGGNSGRNTSFETENLNVATYEALNSSRYTIAVGGFGNRGLWTFSEPGACLLISAPTAGFTNDRFIFTTTIRGRGFDGGDYTDSFGGTSSASPLVSGCIALMLQANPNLAWRDVREILIRTADQNDPTEPGWQTNSAGFHFNNLYGAGAINAHAAVEMAKTWRNLGPELQIEATPRRSAPQALPDGDSSFGREVRIDVSENLRVEHVVLTATVEHPQRGQVEFLVTSPSGTQSLIERRLFVDGGADFNNWSFLSTHHWGEMSAGRWRVVVKDTAEDGVTGTLQDVKLTFYGADPNATPPEPDTTTYAGWADLLFPEDSGLEITAADADPDEDNITNVWEYFRGLNPLVADTEPFFSISTVEGELRIQYDARNNQTELQPSLQFARAFGEWESTDALPSLIRESETSAEDGDIDRVTYRGSNLDESQLFFRFRLAERLP